MRAAYALENMHLLHECDRDMPTRLFINAVTWMPDVHMVHDEVMRNEMSARHSLEAKTDAKQTQNMRRDAYF